MIVITQTRIWQQTLAEVSFGEADPNTELRSRLRHAFIRFRDRARTLAEDIPQSLRGLTVHDITHIDAVWQLADMIVGRDYPLSPTEAFILGGAILLHDLGIALASYPGGVEEVEKDSRWEDAVIQAFRRKHFRAPLEREAESLDPAIRRTATEQVLRIRHAEQAELLGVIEYRHSSRDHAYYLIEDVDLRQQYGKLIGRVAYSHWWQSGALASRFNTPIGAFPGGPADWTIDPLKLALILRAADACHLDARRAPGFLRALRKPTGESEKHWRFQQYVQTPYVSEGQLVFSSANEIPLEDVEAWWLGFDLLNLADRELRDAAMILRDTSRSRFAVDSVAGANDPSRMARHIPTNGWKPVPTKIHVSDVAGLVRTLGGQGLYGANPRVPLRELIQNARDAVVGRRIKEGREKSWGGITVRLVYFDDGQSIEVQDTGLGMSDELLVGPFLDFGSSYWNSQLMLGEHPGLASRGFEPQGRFGIGFFSVFMWGEYVKVVTRRPEDGLESTRVLEFNRGVSGRPILRFANPDERMVEPGTIVHVRLDKPATDPSGLLGPGPIESRFGFRDTVRREVPWRLDNLCAWLCPALDVTLTVEHDGGRTISILASDWETLDGRDLLRRLLLHRNDADEVCDDINFEKVVTNLRDIRDQSGHLFGRATMRRCVIPGGSTQDPINQASAITAGSFRVYEQIEMIGLLLGRPDGPSRMMAKPIVMDCPEALSVWATGQAELVQELVDDPLLLSHYALLIRLLGGDTGRLPIARCATGFLSFDDIARLTDMPDEVYLHEELWDGEISQDLPDNAIAVGAGRMKALYDFSPEFDPRGRADHPSWKKYWMSLWGATIEAIAKAWAVPLQEVLESSEIEMIRGGGSESKDFPKTMKPKIDVIRHPRSAGTSPTAPAPA